MNSIDPIIRLEGLCKAFRGRSAVEDLTLEVPRGAVFGLLGHNGAGKSTTFGMLLGQVRPDRGSVTVQGASVQTQRSRALSGVGAIFEAPAFWDYLSGWRNLGILASYSGGASASEMEDAVRLAGLSSRIHDRVRTYSHGMRQRLALAQALIPRPDLLLLDEPTEGLDPEGIHEIRSLLLRLNREHGITVLLSSHLLSEVEQMCGRIGILHQGRLIHSGAIADATSSGRLYRLELGNAARAEPVLDRFGCRRRGECVELPEHADPGDLVEALVHEGVKVRAVEPVRQTLEQLYLDLVGRQ